MEIRLVSSENMVDELMSTIVLACDAFMFGGHDRRRREPVYWWNDDIVECRRDCIHARRQASTSARGSCDICDEADRDMWGKPYRTVMSSLKAPGTSPPAVPDLMQRAVSTLFPSVILRLIGAWSSLLNRELNKE
ncbi:hypothetical protein TKK_0018803 [Trichogramma kaykai]